MTTLLKPLSSPEIRQHLSKFLNIVSTASGQQSRNKSSWLNLSLKDLTESPIFVLTNIPVARSAALDYFGLLIFENAHLFLCQIENPSLVMDFGEIDDAAAEISQTVHHLVRDKPDIWLSSIFQWSLDSLAEVSRRNYNRRPLANTGLSESLRIYTSNKATKSILDLLNYCIGELLRNSPEKCVSALVELSAKYGNFCDWILTYIGTAYPKAIINELLNCGLKDFYSYIDESITRQNSLTPVQINQRQEQYNREKLASLAAIIGHLARQQSTELKIYFSELLQEALKPGASIQNQYAIPLLLKLASFSRDVAEILVKDLGHLITVSSLFTSYKIIGDIPPLFLFNDNNILNSLISIIVSLGDTKPFVFIYDKLLYFAFGDLSVETGQDVNEKWKQIIRKSCQRILDALLLNMERTVHSQVTFSLDQLLVLQKLDKNWPISIKNLFSNNEIESQHYFQLVCLMCLIKGASKTSEVLASIVYASQSTKQLSAFVSLCAIVAPFLPNVKEEFITKLKFCYHQMSTNYANLTLSDRQWLLNLKQIFTWEKELARKEQINFIGLLESVSNNYSGFVADFIPLAYTEVGDVVIDIFLLVGQPVHLLPSCAVRLVSSLVRLFFHCLKSIRSHNDVKFYLNVCDYVLQFLNSQHQLTVEGLIKSLFSTLFVDDEWKTILLSTQLDLSSTQDNTSTEPEMLASCNRTISSKFTAAALVHSGVIGKGAKKNADAEINEIELLKKLSFVRFIDKLCSSKPAQSGSYCSDICRQMALHLNEHLCTDAITLEHSWDDWETAKNYVPRYLVVFKRVTENPVAWDLLSIVAEAYPCLWYCLPVMRSILGSVLAQLESCIDKTEKPSETLLAVVDRWFYVAKKGKILTEPFVYFCDILPQVNTYEAFVVLSQIWLYFQDIAPELKSLEEHFESTHFKSAEVLKGEAEKYLEPVRNVIQANMASVGYIFPKIFSIS